MACAGCAGCAGSGWRCRDVWSRASRRPGGCAGCGARVGARGLGLLGARAGRDLRRLGGCGGGGVPAGAEGTGLWARGRGEARAWAGFCADLGVVQAVGCLQVRKAQVCGRVSGVLRRPGDCGGRGVPEGAQGPGLWARGRGSAWTWGLWRRRGARSCAGPRSVGAWMGARGRGRGAAQTWGLRRQKSARRCTSPRCADRLRRGRPCGGRAAADSGCSGAALAAGPPASAAPKARISLSYD